MQTRRPVIDLNSADADALGRVRGLTRDVAVEVIRRRPFKSWEDFKLAFGLDEENAREFRRGGAVLGRGQVIKRQKPRGPTRAKRHLRSRTQLGRGRLEPTVEDRPLPRSRRVSPIHRLAHR